MILTWSASRIPEEQNIEVCWQLNDQRWPELVWAPPSCSLCVPHLGSLFPHLCALLHCCQCLSESGETNSVKMGEGRCEFINYQNPYFSNSTRSPKNFLEPYFTLKIWWQGQWEYDHQTKSGIAPPHTHTNITYTHKHKLNISKYSKLFAGKLFW